GDRLEGVDRHQHPEVVDAGRGSSGDPREQERFRDRRSVQREGLPGVERLVDPHTTFADGRAPLDRLFAGGRAALVLVVALIAVAAVAWAYLWTTASSMSSAMMFMGIAQGDWVSVTLFLLVWLVMMLAMMFPAAAPMVQAYVHLSAPKGSQTPWRTLR